MRIEKGRALAHQFGQREVGRLSSELRVWRRSWKGRGSASTVMTELRACEEDRTRHMKEARSSALGFAYASLWIILSSALLMRRLNETNALFVGETLCSGDTSHDFKYRNIKL